MAELAVAAPKRKDVKLIKRLSLLGVRTEFEQSAHGQAVERVRYSIMARHPDVFIIESELLREVAEAEKPKRTSLQERSVGGWWQPTVALEANAFAALEFGSPELDKFSPILQHSEWPTDVLDVLRCSGEDPYDAIQESMQESMKQFVEIQRQDWAVPRQLREPSLCE